MRKLTQKRVRERLQQSEKTTNLRYHPAFKRINSLVIISALQGCRFASAADIACTARDVPHLNLLSGLSTRSSGSPLSPILYALAYTFVCEIYGESKTQRFELLRAPRFLAS
jgi:hypothetical protein